MSEIAVKEKEEVEVEKEIIEVKKEIISAPYKLKFSQRVYVAIKSFFDWNIALVLLLGLLPFWIILTIAIRIDTKGTAIFRQRRIGKNRKEFYCCKWRSMSCSAPKYCATKELSESSSYITKVGKFIRKTSIDEFGQLFNVLTGKMSLIGYRPLIANEKEIDVLRNEKGVYQLKPGITGWAQVNGRDLIDDVKKAELDEYYLKNISFWFDIKICFLTIKKILKSEDIQEGEVQQKNKR